jgi:hypothetical protein
MTFLLPEDNLPYTETTAGGLMTILSTKNRWQPQKLFAYWKRPRLDVDGHPDTNHGERGVSPLPSSGNVACGCVAQLPRRSITGHEWCRTGLSSVERLCWQEDLDSHRYVWRKYSTSFSMFPLQQLSLARWVGLQTSAIRVTPGVV